MTNLVHDLEQCWYISPSWGEPIPPLLVSLLERVNVREVCQSFRLLHWS
ncbi:MAG: DUF1392 family protein [Nostoc sp. DedQUE08]|nr:DUF1392 family protein [Nostoc sp. DedQUE08]MDZ8070425.1 DUF1392 family protein [Nostoc sp. DedQUE08]